MRNNKWLIILGVSAVLIILIFVSAVVVRLPEPPKETIFVFEPTESEKILGEILPSAAQEQTSEAKTEDGKEALVKGSDVELFDSAEKSVEEPAEEPAGIEDEPVADKTQPESIVHSGTGFKSSGSPVPPPAEEDPPPTENGETPPTEGEEGEEGEEEPPAEKDQPIVCTPPFPEPMRGEQVYSVSGSAANPRIARVTVNPLDVNKFAYQTVTVSARDTAGNNITLLEGEVFTDNTSFTFEMELISGTEDNGTWQGQWHNKDKYCSNYRLAVRAVSASGNSQAVLTFR